jgi:hypothetical protein
MFYLICKKKLLSKNDKILTTVNSVKLGWWEMEGLCLLGKKFEHFLKNKGEK